MALSSVAVFSNPGSPVPAGCPHCGRCTTDPAERWRRAGQRVRLGIDPDEPRLVERYLDLARSLAPTTALSAWECARQTTQLLLDTAADPALPMHWRQLCTDYLHRPLSELAAIASDETRQAVLRRLRWQLATLDLNPDHSVDPGADQAAASGG